MDENNHEDVVSLSKRTAANRRNAQLSTGPKSIEGKSQSRRNALNHGILSSALVITEAGKDPAEFDRLLRGLHRDRAPVGALEEKLVEEIAACWWRQMRALQCEADLVRQRHVSRRNGESTSFPLGPNLDRMLRYEASIHRQCAHAINALERLQRARKGEHVPAPVSVQLSND